MIEFEQNACVVAKGFLDAQSTATISQYMDFAIRQGAMPRVDGGGATSYARYADPLIETVLINSLAHVENLTGRKLYPTYSYARVYVKGDVLPPHVDREECEISVTTNVATTGKPWKIWMKAPGKEPVSYELEPGDAIVYKGCEVTHWRDKTVDTEVTAQFMLHYVDQNGPYAARKWDNRPRLGMLSSTRSL